MTNIEQFGDLFGEPPRLKRADTLLFWDRWGLYALRYQRSVWSGCKLKVAEVFGLGDFGIRRKRASHNSVTSVGVDGTSGDLAVCVVRNPVACVAAVRSPGGSDRRSARTGDECSSNGHQCRVNARDRNAVLSASCEPDLARCDVSNAIATLGRPSTARTV
jgi:hypothetical protein